MAKHVSYPPARRPAHSYDHPEDAPATAKAADGETLLTGYRFEGVLYAPDEATARSIIRGSYVRAVVDRARVTGPVDEDGEGCGHADH